MIWSDLASDCKQFSKKNGSGLTILDEHNDKNQLGVAGGLIFGMKKARFNSKDFGTYVISSYSPAP